MQVKESGIMQTRNGETGIPMIALRCPSLIADGISASVFLCTLNTRPSMKLKSQSFNPNFC